MRINIEELEAAREKASEDKADLFDFYHEHWNTMLEALKENQRRCLASATGSHLFAYDRASGEERCVACRCTTGEAR